MRNKNDRVIARMRRENFNAREEKVVKGDAAAASAARLRFDDLIPQNGIFPSKNGRAGSEAQGLSEIDRFQWILGYALPSCLPPN